MAEGHDILVQELRKRVEALGASLPSLVDPANISYSAKTPYKVLAYREAMIWQLEELARCSLRHFESDDLAAAITLTRATVECAAAMWYLMELCQEFLKHSSLEDFDCRVMQLLMGSKNNTDMPEAINVLTMLDKASKSIPLARKSYESLCEYSHPNWSGTSYLFSRIDQEKVLTTFGRNARDRSGPEGMGLNALRAALAMFEHSYNAVGDRFPDVVKRCEGGLENSSK